MEFLKIRKTAETLRKESIARGLCVGSKVKIEYKSLLKDYTFITRRVEHGVVTDLYPHIFVCNVGNYTVCFKYSEFILDMSTKVSLEK